MRIGTRRSALALAQARLVGELLGEHELVEITSQGDIDRSAGDKSRWVGELERALLAGEIDLAVHSAKDLPGEQADGLALFGTTARAAASDALCGASSLDELPSGARVGTSSLRRAAQLRAARADLEVVELRGNVDTRLRKLEESELTAIVLARAGLERLGLTPKPAVDLDLERFVPAPGQGCLALQGRAGDDTVREAVETIGAEKDFACLLAERALAAVLGASCNTPLGAHAWAEHDTLKMRAWVGLPDGSAWLLDELKGTEPERLGEQLAERLREVGAAEMIEQAEALA
ncbi:MAG TPA: hydroxymethylbilane synthase [Solirubrobacteraceae bacterium]|jgi:hydroxymethylbilane synthase